MPRRAQLPMTPWRLGMISGRTSCHFGLKAQVSRGGHHDCALRGSDAVESIPVFEKAAERNNFGRRVQRHRHSNSGGLDEELKRRARKIPREGCRSSGKRTTRVYSSQSNIARRLFQRRSHVRARCGYRKSGTCCLPPISRPGRNHVNVGTVAGHSTRDTSRRPNARCDPI